MLRCYLRRWFNLCFAPFFPTSKRFPAESKELLAAIRGMTGVRPYDPNIYLAAFRRKVDDQSQKNANMRYERLEYLGDAVLGVLMAGVSL